MPIYYDELTEDQKAIIETIDADKDINYQIYQVTLNIINAIDTIKEQNQIMADNVEALNFINQ